MIGFVLVYSALIMFVLSVPGPFHASDKVVLYGFYRGGASGTWLALFWRCGGEQPGSSRSRTSSRASPARQASRARALSGSAPRLAAASAHIVSWDHYR